MLSYVSYRHPLLLDYILTPVNTVVNIFVNIFCNKKRELNNSHFLFYFFNFRSNIFIIIIVYISKSYCFFVFIIFSKSSLSTDFPLSTYCPVLASNCSCFPPPPDLVGIFPPPYLLYSIEYTHLIILFFHRIELP